MSAQRHRPIAIVEPLATPLETRAAVVVGAEPCLPIEVRGAAHPAGAMGYGHG